MSKLVFALAGYQIITIFTAICELKDTPVVSQYPFNHSFNESNVVHKFHKLDYCHFVFLRNIQGFKDFSEILTTDHQQFDSIPLTMLNNHTLKVAVMFTMMESMFKVQLSNGSLANIYGNSNVAFAFLLDLQEIFQFRIEIVPSVGWITEGVNGAITGAGAQVHYGEADIGLDISKPVAYRAKYLTFLHAIKQDHVAIMFRQPKIKVYRNILGRPFQNGLWKRVLQSFIAIFIIAALISRSRRRDMNTVFITIAAAILARSVNMMDILNCSSRSLRIVFFVTSLFGFTMYSIYSAFIVSSLKNLAPPVKKFQDLISFDYEIMAHASLPDFTNVFLSDPKAGSKYAKIAKKNFISEKDSIRRLFTQNAQNDNATENSDNEDGSSADVAWFVLKSDFYYLAMQGNYTTKEICAISKLEPTSRSEHPRLLAMFIRRDGIKSMPSVPLDEGLREHFNRRILDILARGLGNRHILRFESEFQPKCSRRRSPQLQQIRFYDVYAAYNVLAFGLIISLSIMVGEVLLLFVCKITQRSVKYGDNLSTEYLSNGENEFVCTWKDSNRDGFLNESQ